ncbi:PAT1 multi-domain protein [Pyrenophora tritici-repentis]|nr:PAT1 multi-domain protein [Pyrenophora tritici-repentis]
MDFNNPNAYGGQFANSPQHTQFDAQARLQQQANPHGQYGQAASFPGMGAAMGSNVIQPGPPYLQRGKPVTVTRATAATPVVVAEPLLDGALFTNDALACPPALPVKPDPPQLQTPIKQVPRSPVSPVHHARAQDRVATLLDINSILIREVCDLQAQGKAGPIAPTPEQKSEADKAQPSKEYVDYMRRLQANLAYLAQNAEKVPKPGQQVQPGPAIMSLPASPQELVKLYTKLQDLFPGWKGQTAQMKQSPGPQRTSSNMSQPPSAGLQPNWGQNAMQQSMQQAQQQAQQQQQQQQQTQQQQQQTQQPKQESQ